MPIITLVFFSDSRRCCLGLFDQGKRIKTYLMLAILGNVAKAACYNRL